MAFIDKTMYEKLKKWCDFSKEIRPNNQGIMYVNCHDRALTNATIRKLMFELKKEDFELYVSLYSAKNFYHNMRDYYLHIADLYQCELNADALLSDIIEDIPSTCGWIVLIVQDTEALSGDAEKMEEMMETILAFVCKRSSIILIGSGDYKDVFSGCEYTLQEMADGLVAEKEDHQLMIGCYDQEAMPTREVITYETPEKRRDELIFYWRIVYKQLENGFFDYVDFKPLFKETLEYIIPHVTKEQVFRTDLMLIKHIGGMNRYKHEDIEGCMPWEFEAAQKFAGGLHKAIVNSFGDNDNFSEGIIEIGVWIEERLKHHGNLYISGSTYSTIKISTDTLCCEMDELSLIIHVSTYMGNSRQAWKYLLEHPDAGDIKISSEDMEQVTDSINLLTDGIKEAADNTINREPGRKVRRHKGSQDEKHY